MKKVKHVFIANGMAFSSKEAINEYDNEIKEIYEGYIILHDNDTLANSFYYETEEEALLYTK